MKTIKRTNQKAVKGFTLVEMIGVLAVIAILAGMLIPKIFEAIRNSRINATLEAYNTIKAAVLENYAKWGRFATSAGAVYTGSSFDGVLMQELRLDARAAAKIPVALTNTTSMVYVNVTTGGGFNNSGYDLDTSLAGRESINGTYTVELIIQGVPIKDAMDISARLDGPAMSFTSTTASDGVGRVEYTINSQNPKIVDLYLYITHN